MFEDDFLETMTDEIVWEPFLGSDANGMEIYGRAQKLQCRISPKQQKIQDHQGTEVVSNASIYPAWSPDIKADDKLTLPDGETKPILRVDRPPDTDGAHHTKVMI